MFTYEFYIITINGGNGDLFFMKLKDKEVQGEPKKFSISILLYVTAIIVALLGIALLVDDIFIFKSTVAQYVMQGYSADDVMKGLLPTQLLPGIFEALALYGGIAVALIGIGVANRRISKYIPTLNIVTNDEDAANDEDVANDEDMAEDVLKDNIEELEDMEITNEDEPKKEVEDIESK